MRPEVLLSPLVASLLAGCQRQLSCPPSDDAVDTRTVQSIGHTFDSFESLEAALDDEGNLTAAACEEICGSTPWMKVTAVHGCALADGAVAVGSADSATIDTAGTDAVYAEIACDVTGRTVCEGRHHACIAHRTPTQGDDLGAYFAGAWLSETTSVQAFLALAGELERLGAPEALVARARTSALDEIVHARLIAGFAAEQGATLGHAVFRRIPDRDPLSLAIENAVEGCVRETFAAFVASHQSCAAAPQYRAAYRVIAQDEVRHAELAWAIDGWLVSQLDLAGRQEVEAAREAAVQQIYDAVSPPPERAAAAGLPSVEASHRLLDGLVLHLWSRLAA